MSCWQLRGSAKTGLVFDTLQPTTDRENLIYYRHESFWEKYMFGELCAGQGLWAGQVYHPRHERGHIDARADERGYASLWQDFG